MTLIIIPTYCNFLETSDLLQLPQPDLSQKTEQMMCELSCDSCCHLQLGHAFADIRLSMTLESCALVVFVFCSCEHMVACVCMTLGQMHGSADSILYSTFRTLNAIECCVTQSRATAFETKKTRYELTNLSQE